MNLAYWPLKSYNGCNTLGNSIICNVECWISWWDIMPKLTLTKQTLRWCLIYTLWHFLIVGWPERRKYKEDIHLHTWRLFNTKAKYSNHSESQSHLPLFGMFDFLMKEYVIIINQEEANPKKIFNIQITVKVKAFFHHCNV